MGLPYIWINPILIYVHYHFCIILYISNESEYYPMILKTPKRIKIITWKEDGI